MNKEQENSKPVGNSPFQPGDRVICVDINWAYRPLPGEIMPLMCGIYTVRHVRPNAERNDGQMTILLEEIVNRPQWFNTTLLGRVFTEFGFYCWHFRKLGEDELLMDAGADELVKELLEGLKQLV
jgi:hypothetical protein